eukprot:6340298-Amphidinium_carterae.1
MGRPAPAQARPIIPRSTEGRAPSVARRQCGDVLHLEIRHSCIERVRLEDDQTPFSALML